MLLSFLAVAAAASSTAYGLHISPSFENTAILRAVELGGSSVHVTTTYTARSLIKNNGIYYFTVPKELDDKLSWVEAKLKGTSQLLSVDKHGIEALLAHSDAVVYYSVNLPRVLDFNETLSLQVNTIESHASYPLPAVAKQNDPQSLLYETEVYVTSPYRTVIQRTKLRSPTPNILSYSQLENSSKFTLDAPVTQSGAALTYGPYNDLPPSDGRDFADSTQETINVHYAFDNTVITVDKLRRAAEISHWGANINIQDKIHLRNDGPKLDGHFSRLAHQQNAYQRKTGHVLQNIVLQLPAGARDVYYTDLIGNVSTSRFRPPSSKSRARAGAERTSVLDFKPRYPLLGGWNYSFTLGWDAPLGDSARYDAKSEQYLVAIPFFTHIPGSVVDDAEVTIILPEGATGMKVSLPFAIDSMIRHTHITYLDTRGRPTITFKKKNLTEKHTGVIYVSYSLSTAAHLSKVVAVSTAFLLLFSLMYILRRIDLQISKSA